MAASSPDAAPAGVRVPLAPVLALAATVELLQVLRAFFPLGYHLVGSLGFVVTPIVLLAVFTAPLLYPVLLRLFADRTPVVLAVLLVAARVALQVQPSLPLAIVAVVVGLLAVTAVLPVAAGRRFGADLVATGTLLGLGLDIALRSWRATDDVVWSQGWQAWLDPSLLVPIVLLLATLGALRGPAASAPAWSWTLLLMPQTLLWTSLAFVGSSGRVSLAVSTVVLLGATAAGLVLLVTRPSLPSWVAALLVLAVSIGMPMLSGWPVLLLAFVGVAVAPVLVRGLASRASGRPWSAVRHGSVMAAGAMTMFVLLLLYPLHYEIPLPIDNAWLPGIAVALACLPLLRRPGAAEGAPLPGRRGAVVGIAGGAVLLGGMAHLGMVGGSPSPGPDDSLPVGEPREGELRVATYNIGQGQHADSGRLAFREVAEVLVGLDADVVALQEVARGWPLTSMSDFDAWLRAHTDWTIEYTPAADRQFGNALVARVPLDDVTTLDLGQGGGAQRRSAQRAAVPDGVTVYGAHLQARNSTAAEQTRLDQMQMIVDDWAERPATVVAGDLNPRNEYTDASETPPKVISNLEVFTDAGLVTTQPTQLCTAPTSNDNCSDYVFRTADLEPLVPHEVVEVDVSDHRAVLARLQPPPG